MKMPKIKEIIVALEKLAPTAYQEGYDNAGLLVGDASDDVKGVLISLDVTEQVVEEAVRRNCNLIVAHHPIVFKGLKKLNGSNYVERTVIKAIRSNVSIYAIHTNLDHVAKGVNYMIAEKLGLQNVRILAPKKNVLKKLTFFCPVADAQTVLDALFTAGAGRIGHYENCSFSVEGKGSFKPANGASPVIGKVGVQEEVQEYRSEVMFPSFMESKMLKALRDTHPYEEIAYYMSDLENENQEVGAGAVGELAQPLSPEDFLGLLRQNMNTHVIRYTSPASTTVRRVAVCGGAGSFLLNAAQRADADVFVTADYKYHEFFDAENNIMICDIGHYESEVFTKDLLYNYLSGIFSNFALCLSDVNTNPVKYFV
jgi:dinuclear metal center YbgI/SA1388 family protein